MKRWLAIVCASTCLALALAGCSSGSSSSAASAASSAASSSASSAASSAASEASASEASASAAASSAMTGMPNPWSDVATAEEAAAGAGLDSFSVPTGVEIGLGVFEEANTKFSCMEGIAQAVCEYPAVELLIRKGTAAAVIDGDISGDYSEYANTWTQNIKGLEITCYGNREGESTKTVWNVGDDYYCILAQGLGGDTDFGLSADDLNSLVNAIQ